MVAVDNEQYVEWVRARFGVNLPAGAGYSGRVRVHFGWQGMLPLKVAMMFEALAGAITVGLLGTVRILRLAARARRAAAGIPVM